MSEHSSVAGATHQCSLEIFGSDLNKTRLSPLTKQSRTIRSQTYKDHSAPQIYRDDQSPRITLHIITTPKLLDR